MTRTDEIKKRLDGTTLDVRDWFARRARESFIDNAPSDIEWLLRENTRLSEALEAIVERSKRVSGEGGSAVIAIKALEASK